jgi:NAD(P)-dependent dehydrogenase (short-subunit alcohol dehydrogenase family)
VALLALSLSLRRSSTRRTNTTGSAEALLAIFNTNLFGAVRLTKALLPHFRERRSGTILFLSSRSGWYGDPWCGAYAGSKFALEGMVESLRWETEKYDIKTLLVVPGRFRSPFLSGPIAAPGKTEAYRDDYEGFLKTIAEEEDGKQPGDLKKGVSVVLDLVREEGIAQGRKVPFRIPIGTDCYETIEQECETTLKEMREWKDVIVSTDYPEGT